MTQDRPARVRREEQRPDALLHERAGVEENVPKTIQAWHDNLDKTLPVDVMQ